MFVRVLFLLLLALNIGGACWLVFAKKPVDAASATDPGVPKLQLLSERDGGGPLQSAELAGPAETAAERANDHCRTIGPFPTQADLRAAMNALTPMTKRIQFHETRTTQTRGHWVYLPAMPTREQALATARSLSAKGVRDYYVVTAGDQQNTISLGLFREPANAEKRRAEITALGFSPQVNTRTEDTPQYWIDAAVAAGDEFDWRPLARGSDLREERIDCF